MMVMSGFHAIRERTRVVLSWENKVVDVADGLEVERLRPWC